jgi:hypothetical protein
MKQYILEFLHRAFYRYLAAFGLVSFARGYVERPNLITAAALNTGGQTAFSKEFPMGEGWYNMNLRINIVFVVGTGTTPITEGELLFVKNVLLRTDRGEIICNLPGRAIWKLAVLKNGTLPYKDAIAAASATYRVHLPIYFCDPESGPFSMLRPEDTLLDTSRYNSISLIVTLGGVADLLTTPGTSTVTATMDLEVERSFGKVPGVNPGEGGKPVAHINYDMRPPVDASVTTAVDLERSADMSLKRLFLHTGSSGTAGVPWSGANSDSIVATVNVKDQNRFIEKDRIWSQIQYQNKLKSSLEAILSGVVAMNFVHDRSTASALATADKATLQATITIGTAPANSIMTFTQEGIRNLK